MYKTTITLKQHTPIIHFQHDQEGATLRATELKPKLDRFIYTKYSELFPDDGKSNLIHHFNPENKGPSPYKIRVESSGEKNRILISSGLNWKKMKALDEANRLFLQNVAFFAEEKGIGKLFLPKLDDYGRELRDNNNQVKEYVYNSLAEKEVSKWGILHDSEIKVQVWSFSKEIIEIIKSSAPYFFAYENFGSRQNKGFGCFSDVSKENKLSNHDLMKKVFKFRYVKKLNLEGTRLKSALEGQNLFFKVKRKFENGEENLHKLVQDSQRRRIVKLQDALTTLKLDYQCLKSGFNFGEDYKKSLLFLYFLHKQGGKRWEKRKVKSALDRYFNSRRNQNARLKTKKNKQNQWNSNLEDHILDDAGNWVEIQRWQDENGDDYKYEYVRAVLGMAGNYEFLTNKPEKYIANVSSKEVERYKSPIVCKIIDDNLYFLGNEPEKKIKDVLESSNFDFELYYGKQPLPSKYNFSLPFPSGFELGDFLEYAFSSCPYPEKIQGYNKF